MPVSELVSGDIVFLEAGDMIPADLRLIESNQIRADESALTGESVPVGKGIDVLPENTSLTERTNMLLKGTTLTEGTGKGLVVRFCNSSRFLIRFEKNPLSKKKESVLLILTFRNRKRVRNLESVEQI